MCPQVSLEMGRLRVGFVTRIVIGASVESQLLGPLARPPTALRFRSGRRGVLLHKLLLLAQLGIRQASHFLQVSVGRLSLSGPPRLAHSWNSVSRLEPISGSPRTLHLGGGGRNGFIDSLLWRTLAPSPALN